MQKCFARQKNAARGLSVLLVLFATIGCQSWHTSSVLPGLTASKGERLVVKQAKNDPFPSPSDVGFKGQRANDE